MRPIYFCKQITRLAFAVLLMAFSNLAAAGKKDSLASVLSSHTQDDTIRVKLLLAVADIYKDTNQDSLTLYTNRAMALAEKIGFKTGKAHCLSTMGLIYLRQGEYEKAIDAYRQALAIYELNGSKLNQSHILRNIADIYYRQIQYPQSIAYYNKSIALSEEIGDYVGTGIASLSLGGVYFDQVSYSEAIAQYFKALKIFEKNDDRNGISMTLVNIATVYSTIGNYKLAKEYVEKCLKASEGLTEKEVLFTNMINAGVVYGDMKDYKSALAAFLKGRKLADSLGDRTWKNICLGNIADAYYELGMYDTAYAKYQELLHQPGGMEDTTMIVMAETCIGLILKQKGQVQEGIKHLQQAFAIAQNKEMKRNIFDISGALSEAYHQLRDYKRAFEYHKIYFDYNDSLNAGKSDKKIQQLHFDYELGKKESQIALLNKDKIIAQDRSVRQRIVIWSSLSGLALVIVISILLYRSSQREKLNSKKISDQKKEIEKQAVKLEELNKFKDKTFSVLSHDLRSPVGALTATMAMLDEKIMTGDDFMKLKPEVQTQLNAVNLLLDNLLNWAKGYMHGETTEIAESVDIYKIASDNIAITQDVAGKKKLSIKNNIPRATFAIGNPGQLEIVIRNLLMNAIKFSNNEGNITLDGKREAGKVIVSITDEGVGMNSEQLDKLFTASANNSTYGTSGEKGTGLGLLLCYEFVMANKGTITAKSQVNKGTTFTIELPAAT